MFSLKRIGGLAAILLLATAATAWGQDEKKKDNSGTNPVMVTGTF